MPLVTALSESTAPYDAGRSIEAESKPSVGWDAIVRERNEGGMEGARRTAEGL